MLFQRLKNTQVPSLLFALVICISGCFHPVSTMFETAHSLEPGETKVMFAGTFNPESDYSMAGGSFVGIVDRGVSSNMDMRLRIERRFNSGRFDPIFGLDFEMPYSFFEVAPKWSNGKGVAFALPFQTYMFDGGDMPNVFIDPRLILTRRSQDETTELTGVLRSQFGYIDEDFGIIPGVSFGAAVSENLDKYAVRLDVGYNMLRQVTFGLGFQFKLDNAKELLEGRGDLEGERRTP